MRELKRAHQSNEGTEHTLLYTTIFIVAILISMSLLLIALVVTVAELLGSLTLSLLLNGVVLLLIAIVIYYARLRPIYHAIRDQLQTIYEVSAIAQIGYEWVRSKAESFIYSILRDKL